MEKHKLLSLVNKTSSYFDEYNTPTSVYNSLWDDNHFKPLLDKMSAEDIVFYCFLIPIKTKGQDIDESYDRIEHNMYSVELVEIYNTEPPVDCPHCDSGVTNCDKCDGIGEIQCRRCDGTGEEDCDYCEGSGIDEEGDECDMCEGSGRMTCGRCDGDSNESCGFCGGDGLINCQECDGNGTINDNNQTEILLPDYISWSIRWKEYFFNKKPDQEIDAEDIRNFHNNNQTLFLGEHQEMTNDYQGYDEGNMLLYVTKDTKDLNLKKYSDRVYP